MSTTQQVQILLVEDNADDIELTLHALQEHNLVNQVEVVRSGTEALDYLLGSESDVDSSRRTDGARPEQMPRLILLDLKLPKMHGLQLLEHLKADERTREIPVVVLTSSAEDPDIKKSYRLGANSYIVKPVEFDTFVGVVGQLGFYWLAINKPPH